MIKFTIKWNKIRWDTTCIGIQIKLDKSKIGNSNRNESRNGNKIKIKCT